MWEVEIVYVGCREVGLVEWYRECHALGRSSTTLEHRMSLASLNVHLRVQSRSCLEIKTFRLEAGGSWKGVLLAGLEGGAPDVAPQRSR
jgi:hypothetical protein